MAIGTILEGKYKINSLIDQNILGGLYLAQNVKTRKDILINFLPCDVNSCAQRLFFDQYFVAQNDKNQYPQYSMPARKYPGIFITNIGATKEGRVYLILEYVDYPSLKQEVTHKTQLSPLQTVTIALQLSNIIMRLNSLGVIYRYINPDTIMVALNDKHIETKALDFDIDLDKLYSSYEFTQIYNALGITYDQTPSTPQTSCQCGVTFSSHSIFCSSCGKRRPDYVNNRYLQLLPASIEFMTPETYDGQEGFYPQTDIYAIGILLYWMLSGKFPFQGRSVAMTLMMHIQANPASLVAENPHISSDLEAIVARTLAKKPENRYASFNELSNDLKTVFYELSSTGSNKTKPKSETGQPFKLAIQNSKSEVEHHIVTKKEEKKSTYTLFETASNFFWNLLKK